MKITDLLKGTNFRFNKALGQNFILDENLLLGIVSDSGVEKSDVVVEIGTGAGTLTRVLAQRAEKVFSFEVDKNLQPIFEHSLKGLENVDVFFRDVLKMSDEDFKSIVGDTAFKVVANLPYYITTPLIMRFLESDLNVVSLTVTVQSEVADRLVAAAGKPEYSAITLAVLSRGEAKICRKIDRKCFYPPPNVDSAVVRIDVDNNKLKGENKELIHRLVRSAFAMRRKTLNNNLCASFGISKADADLKITSAGLPPMIRGESLTLEDFVKLSHNF